VTEEQLHRPMLLNSANFYDNDLGFFFISSHARVRHGHVTATGRMY